MFETVGYNKDMFSMNFSTGHEVDMDLAYDIPTDHKLGSDDTPTPTH